MSPLKTIEDALRTAALSNYFERVAKIPPGVWNTPEPFPLSQEFRDYRMAFRDIANSQTSRS